MTNTTIDKLRNILKINHLMAKVPPDADIEFNTEAAIEAIIAWALEAVPEKKTGTDLGGWYDGYNQAISEIRAKFTGGTE